MARLVVLLSLFLCGRALAAPIEVTLDQVSFFLGAIKLAAVRVLV